MSTIDHEPRSERAHTRQVCPFLQSRIRAHCHLRARSDLQAQGDLRTQSDWQLLKSGISNAGRDDRLGLQFTIHWNHQLLPKEVVVVFLEWSGLVSRTLPRSNGTLSGTIMNWIHRRSNLPTRRDQMRIFLDAFCPLCQPDYGTSLLNKSSICTDTRKLT